ncbi:MAG: molybdopterin molybdenumtransferase MoeA, partial [Pseudomonadota bacterium]
MLSVLEAQAAILREMGESPTQRVAVTDSAGRILRQVVTAERDQPPFDRVTMDGIAIRHADAAAGRRDYPIVGTQHAGDAEIASEAGECIEIMTGASLPDSVDCVIPVERISVGNTTATLEDGYTPQPRQFIHPRGSDHQQG